MPISRRKFVGSATLLAAGASLPSFTLPRLFGEAAAQAPLLEFGYADVTLNSELHEKQFENTYSLLMELSEDSLLKPLRQMSGLPAPGADLGGWYHYNPNYDYQKDDEGFAPACPFGQWVSALARAYAITGNPAIREKVLRLNRLYAPTITADFYIKNRFPAYCYDKLVLGLIDSHTLVGDPSALSLLERTTDTALPHMPRTAIEHGRSWRPNTDESYTWDESYTISENLFLAYQRGAGNRYRELGERYLDNEYYDPLSRGENNLAGRHAYSYVNSLSSAMQAYLTLGSEKHLRAAKNAFDMLTAQSFATGGWGPEETLRAPGSGDVGESLNKIHNSFETPCGSYAHFKLTRYLLRVTRESRYGDSMERVMYNTILGAKPMLADGSTFYYSDYTFTGHKFYHDGNWPCCAGTMPQVTADYRINTYFRDPAGVYVNLYIPSSLRWTQDGAQISLTQKSAYPYDSSIQLEVTAHKAKEFTLNLRIPQWAQQPSISVNGRRVATPVLPGSFAAIRRQWKSGDRIEVNLPMTTRLQAVDEQHPDTVALMYGPLVLFAITDKQPAVTRNQLLAAKIISPGKWQVETSSGAIAMLPFTAIKEERYTTYVRAT